VNPADLLFSETHEWVHVTEDAGAKIATIGISDFAVKELSDLVFLELPEVGKQLSAGDEFGEVESVKSVSSMYCPIDGEVIETNGGLPESLDSLGEDPFGAGWMIKVRISDETGLARLMDHAAYQKQCSED